MARPIGAASRALTLVGVAVSIAPLFLHGWVHVAVQFAPRTPSANGVLSRVGAEVDAQVAAIVAREVATAISPTLWQYPGHVFQALIALLLLAATAALIAPVLSPRPSMIAQCGAFLSSIAAAVLVVIAFFRIDARIAALPAQITEAMQGNALVKQALAATDSTPHVSGGPGWPLIVVTAGVALALLGTLAGLILALRRPGTPEILHAGNGPHREAG
jgi:hypothetical protein